MPVSAKMRLGYDDDARAEECALAIEAGGAGELVVHARTKAQGYRPPAHWHRVAQVREVLRIPVVANGEIWTLADALRCREASGCHDLMLGRGIVADPGLALDIRAHDAGQSSVSGLAWESLRPMLRCYWDLVAARTEPRHRAGRLKQWLNLLRRRYPQAEEAYQTIREVQAPAAVEALLFLKETPGRPKFPCPPRGAGWAQPGPGGAQ